jgi:hypothetical protein
MKNKSSSEKRRTLGFLIRVKTRAFLANKKQGNFSKRNLLGSNHLLQQTNKVIKKTKTTDAPRKIHSA